MNYIVIILYVYFCFSVNCVVCFCNVIFYIYIVSVLFVKSMLSKNLREVIYLFIFNNNYNNTIWV